MRVQFVIFLSALLASLTGLVAGERQPVRAQVEMSTTRAVAMAEKAVATVQLAGDPGLSVQPAARPMRIATPVAAPTRTAKVRTRLALKQSWLF